MKQCFKCKEYKEESQFGKNTRSPDGLRYNCIKCRSISNEYYEKFELIRKNKLLLNEGKRICPRCNIEQSVNNFYSKTNGKPKTTCKECDITKNSGGIEKRKAYLDWTKEHDELLLSGRCRCTLCKEIKDLSEFHIKKQDGKPRSNCKACIRKTAKDKYHKDIHTTRKHNKIKNGKRDKQKLNEFYRKHNSSPRGRAIRKRIENKRRALLLECKHEDYTHLIEKMLKAGICKCFYCGLFIDSNEAEIEHKTPVTKKGDDIPENIVFACRSCNAIKGTKTLEECMELGIDFHV